jgi:signal transduction histidine kinase
MNRDQTGKQGFFRELAGYLGQYRQVMAVFLLFALIFAAVFSLYRLAEEAVLYASGLCALLGLLLLGIGFFRERRKRREREDLLAHINLLPDTLPAAHSPAERDYQAMVLALRQFNRDIAADFMQERTQSLDYFTAWMHQIKTPIAAMQMMLQEEDTQVNRALMLELFRVEQYADMALSYLRLGDDASDFVFKSYALDPIIRTAVRKYAPQFVNKRIRLVYEPVDFMVLTDEKWLCFIIEQFLSNAVKYTDRGSVTITLSADRVLSVADTGIGIAAEDLPRIFEKGFTGYNGRSNRKSTGLGLYLCRRAADRLSHRLSVQSTPGKGSLFSIDLSHEAIDIE